MPPTAIYAWVTAIRDRGPSPQSMGPFRRLPPYCFYLKSMPQPTTLHYRTGLVFRKRSPKELSFWQHFWHIFIFLIKFHYSNLLMEHRHQSYQILIIDEIFSSSLTKLQALLRTETDHIRMISSFCPLRKREKH